MQLLEGQWGSGSWNGGAGHFRNYSGGWGSIVQLLLVVVVLLLVVVVLVVG